MGALPCPVAMSPHPLLRALTAAALAASALAAAPVAHAWTLISCDLTGTVSNLPATMRQFRTDGTELSQVIFRLKVKAAHIPDGERADSDCAQFVNRDVDVVLENVAARTIRKGKPLKVRYRYDESLGQSQSTKYELAP
ncbi:hypothetical protein [Achromobacter deleyi]|uniref:hypothetical protein n=1 Tax=Achromobacter deleyi TaxID=1353891 RepID=UPI001F269CA5|nr:hypothetical protein [Achromobacter deleyi]UIP22280.1 hypothetical protein LYZ39_07135 [Achromobacter deleyi]